MEFRSVEDLFCTVCHDVFENPVLLPCSHSFCKDCIKSWWLTKRLHECPVCKSVARTRFQPRNLALRNLCESFLLAQRARAGFESFCNLHFEKLKLFCLDDEQPACVVCRDSQTHANHRFRPVDEFAKERKEEIRLMTVPLRSRLEKLKKLKGNCDETAGHIEVQARNTERQIKEKFKELSQILQVEEKTRIAALRKEEKLKSKRMREKTDSLSREISSLSDTIRVTEEELRAKDVSFLQNYKAAVERVQWRPLLDYIEIVPGALIDVAKHLVNLTYPACNKIKEMISYTPVVLDPNTAHPHLILSEDLTSVRFGRRQKLPKNPERIDYYRCVLGSEGFDSGTHSWDVEVKDTVEWLVGVAAESAHRRRDLRSGLWLIRFSYDKYSALYPPNNEFILQIKKRVERIRIHLDCNRKKLSFSDADSNRHIHTFRYPSTNKLFPYFSNGRRSPIKILPPTVSTQTPSKLIRAVIGIVVVFILIVMIM
ncbi:E3 ubiquitin-protein ligase TRIM39-like [Brachyistius frenatus]|uniref:E3 ubiquitin-protein ligase TRIM39-like n=1 Tax=Brachyistius frenatus TaxID=100188 RepID=UPI0037E81C02